MSLSDWYIRRSVDAYMAIIPHRQDVRPTVQELSTARFATHKLELRAGLLGCLLVYLGTAWLMAAINVCMGSPLWLDYPALVVAPFLAWLVIPYFRVTRRAAGLARAEQDVAFQKLLQNL